MTDVAAILNDAEKAYDAARASGLLKVHTTLRRRGPGDVEVVEVSLCPADCPDIEWGDGAYFRVSGSELKVDG